MATCSRSINVCAEASPPEVLGAETLVLRSHLTEPISKLSLLRQSLLFAELSYVAYLPRADAGRFANDMGMPEVRYYDQDGAQAYLFANDHDIVLVCRGTEPHEWNDIKADLDALTAVAETAGRVHRGFKREVDDLWPRLEQAMLANERPLWFAGHSLGGAMAAICAGRCKLSAIPSDPAGLFTYGAPRVGDRRYVNYVRLNYYRWVNNNDIVPRVPPSFLGYRHAGQEIYLDHQGRVRRMTGWLRLRDRWRGFVQGLKGRKIDHFADHNLAGYIDGIWRAIEREEHLSPRNGRRRITDSSVPYPHFLDHTHRGQAPVAAPPQG